MSINRRHSSMPRKQSGCISASDLVKLLPADSKRGFLRERCVSKILKVPKWRHRFVVLANGALYVYENEMSKAPDASLPLVGYTGVQRESSNTCAWVFALVPGMPSMKRKSFACASDQERKQWMTQIRDKLLANNNIQRLSPSSLMLENLQKWKDVSAEEREYLELEIPVMAPEDETSSTDGKNVKDEASNLPVDSESDDDDDDNDKEEDDEGPSVLKMNTAIHSHIEEAIRNVSLRKTSSSSCGSGGGTAGGSGAQTQSPRGSQTQSPRGSHMIPPRYSAVVEGEEHEYQNHANNPKAVTMGLEKACTIKDNTICQDREKCIAMLRSTKRVGTYLIRESRSSDHKVLSILGSKDIVKEFRIEESYGLYHFVVDPTFEFSSIDALLSFYSSHKVVPKMDMFLGWGIHECVEGDGMYEPLDD